MSRKLLFGSAASISLLALGCQVPEEISVENEAIIDGVPDNIATHAAVVALTDGSGFSFCTGTYVGNRTIVTAGHCNEFGAPDFVYFGNNANTDANNCFNGNQASCNKFVDVLTVDDPGFNGQTLQNDIATVTLTAEPVINGVAIQPIPFTRFSDGTNLTGGDEGAEVSFSGFGVTNGVNQTGGGVKLVVGGDADPDSTLILDAVGPDNATGIDGNQVFYNQPVNIGGPCNGDSGGPMFIKRNGVEFLAAVTSFGDQTCSDFGVSTRVDVFEDFIDGGGNPPPPENCTNNIDDDQDGFVDCDDAQCANQAVCDDPGNNDPERCDNNLDDDGDGTKDCDDSDCFADEVNCGDGGVLGCKISAAPSKSHNEEAAVFLFALFGFSLVVARRRK